MRRARVVGVLALVLCGALPTSPANADLTESVIEGSALRLVSITDSEMLAMSPEETVNWDVGVSITTAEPGEVVVSLQVLAASPDAFSMTISKCDVRWTPAGCADTEVLVTASPVAAGDPMVIDQFKGEAAPWYRIELTMAAGSPGDRAELRLTAEGAGDSVSTDGSADRDQLATTGFSLWPQAAIAIASIVLGLVIISLARARRDGSTPALGGSP